MTNRGTYAVEVGDTLEMFLAQIQKCFHKVFLEQGGPELNDLIKTVIKFIEAPVTVIELPLDIQGAAFQERVWNVLCLGLPGPNRPQKSHKMSKQPGEALLVWVPVHQQFQQEE